MATNEYLERAEKFTLAVPLAANGGVGPISGDPLIWGLAWSPVAGLPLVAENSMTPPGSLTPTGNITVKRIGAFYFTVQAMSGINGLGVTINPGDQVYADGGTVDATTGILYGFTLNANKGTGWPFGRAMAAVPAGLSASIPVMLGAK